jgi:hypothetical protein
MAQDIGDDLVTDGEMVAIVVNEMRRLAIDGTAPTVEDYSERRYPGTPSHTAVLRRTGLSWTDLARRAGLRRSNHRCHGPAPLLPAHIVEALKFHPFCDCGQPAVAIGRFFSLTASESEVPNAMLLCVGCMQVVDGDVEVELINGSATTAGIVVADCFAAGTAIQA